MVLQTIFLHSPLLSLDQIFLWLWSMTKSWTMILLAYTLCCVFSPFSFSYTVRTNNEVNCFSSEESRCYTLLKIAKNLFKHAFRLLFKMDKDL